MKTLYIIRIKSALFSMYQIFTINMFNVARVNVINDRQYICTYIASSSINNIDIVTCTCVVSTIFCFDLF